MTADDTVVIKFGWTGPNRTLTKISVRSLHYKALTLLDQFYFNNVLNFQTLFSKDALNKLQDSKEKHAFWQTISSFKRNDRRYWREKTVVVWQSSKFHNSWNIFHLGVIITRPLGDRYFQCLLQWNDTCSYK